MRILTVEDDELLAQTLASVLTKQNYAVDIALDGETGWELALATPYDLILLDVMLPKLDGISLCRQLRQGGHRMPILLLTAKDKCTDKVSGLDAGADDYVTKPIDFDELAARVRAMLRRGHTASSPLLTWAALSVDPSSLEVVYDGQPLHLTATEHRLLELFLRNPQHVFSRNAILEHLWTLDEQPEASTIKTYVKNLRHKFKAVGAPAEIIETVYGLGYRLGPEPDQSVEPEPSFPTPLPSVEQILKEQQALQALAKARDSFKTKIRDRLNVIRQAVEALESRTLNTKLHEQSIYEAHRFAGALGTFGLATASLLAERIEDLLQVQPLNADQAPQLRQLVDKLAQELKGSLAQPALLEDNALVHPQLLVISEDHQWMKLLNETACTYTVSLKLVPIAKDRRIDQALHLIQTEQPDVVLLDLDGASTPYMMNLLTQISLQLSLPVLVITGSDYFEYRIEVARRGGRRFLLKSTSVKHVLEESIQASRDRWSRNARVLAVVSDRLTIEEIQGSLEPWGLQLELLTQPQLFWTTLTRISPDLLVLDVEQTWVSGIDLCRVVRTDSNWDRLPILLVTPHVDAERIHQLFAAGADACIPKPIVRTELLACVLNQLARAKEQITDPWVIQ